MRKYAVFHVLHRRTKETPQASAGCTGYQSRGIRPRPCDIIVQFGTLSGGKTSKPPPSPARADWGRPVFICRSTWVTSPNRRGGPTRSRVFELYTPCGWGSLVPPEIGGLRFAPRCLPFDTPRSAWILKHKAKMRCRPWQSPPAG